jgi:hypothetical protein
MDMGQGLRTYDIETKVINLHEFKTNVIDLWHKHINDTKHGLRRMVCDSSFFVIWTSANMCDIKFTYYDLD